MNPNIESRKQKKQTRKQKRRRWIYWILIPISIILIAGIGWGVRLYLQASSAISDSYEEIDRGDNSNYSDVELDLDDEDHISILIMGIDESEHRDNKDSARTDALILATLNKEENNVKLLSIPRDSLVYIPELGMQDKINHAHALGNGPSTTIETVEHLLDIPIHYFVRLNFEAFVEVVDALGGITVDVPYEFWESDSNDKKNSIHLTEGEQLLNGEEALALARTRKHDNDVERGKRQLEIIHAIKEKATSLSSTFKYHNVIEALGDNLAMNLKVSDVKSLVSYGMKNKDLEIESYTLDGEDYWENNIYYWLIDEDSLQETRTLLKNHLDIEDTLSVEEENDESYYQDSIEAEEDHRQEENNQQENPKANDHQHHHQREDDWRSREHHHHHQDKPKEHHQQENHHQGDDSAPKEYYHQQWEKEKDY